MQRPRGAVTFKSGPPIPAPVTAPGRRLATKPWEFCRHIAEDIGARLAGSRQETTAAHYGADVLRTMGYAVDVDEFSAPKDPWLVPGVLVGLAALAGLVGVVATGPAAVAAALFVALAHAEALGFPIVGRFVGGARTRNVWARMPGAGPVARTILLVAHVDSPRALPDWVPRTRTGVRLSAGSVGVAAIAVPGFLVVATFPGLEALRFAAVPFSVVLLVAAFLMLSLRGGAPTNGANDNASGVAAVLAAAGEHAASPLEQSHLEILLTGAAGSGPWGLRRFAGRYGRHYIRPRTYVLDVDRVGRGTFTALAHEGLLVTTRGDPQVVGLLKEAARHEGHRLRVGALPFGGDGHAARLRGWRAATLTGTDAKGEVPDLRSVGDALPRVDPLQVEDAARLVIAFIRALDASEAPPVDVRRRR